MWVAPFNGGWRWTGIRSRLPRGDDFWRAGGQLSWCPALAFISGAQNFGERLPCWLRTAVAGLHRGVWLSGRKPCLWPAAFDSRHRVRVLLPVRCCSRKSSSPVWLLRCWPCWGSACSFTCRSGMFYWNTGCCRLRLNGQVIVVQRQFPANAIQRGDWIAYKLGSEQRWMAAKERVSASGPAWDWVRCWRWPGTGWNFRRMPSP